MSQEVSESKSRLAAEIEARRAAETALRKHVERTAKQQETLLRLASAVELPWRDRLRAILKEDAETLEIRRVSYWRIVPDGSAIQLEKLYLPDTGAYETGLELFAKDFPGYFSALNTGTVIVANDANTDPHTREFSESYLRPLNIGAMLDVPVFVRGKLMGVVCHEHVGGVRHWTQDEQQFAVSVAHLVSLAIESGDRLRAEEALRESEARFRAIAQVSPVPLLVSSIPEGRCIWANSAVSELSGMPEEELVGKLAPDFYVDPEERARVLTEMRENGFVAGREVRFKRVDGSQYWAKVSMRPIHIDGQAAVIVGLTDVTEQKRLEHVLRHAALHDSLTGLPNRVLLFDILHRELGRAQRDDAYRFALLYFDLDGFKAVNDELGHDVGDQVLKAVAQRVRACLRPMDAVARIGGDEFAVLVADVKGDKEVDSVRNRIQAAIGKPQQLGDRERAIGASFGTILADGSNPDAEAILREADLAMYKNKVRSRPPQT